MQEICDNRYTICNELNIPTKKKFVVMRYSDGTQRVSSITWIV